MEDNTSVHCFSEEYINIHSFFRNGDKYISKELVINVIIINKDNVKFPKGQYILNLSEHLDKQQFMISIDLPGCSKLDFMFSAKSPSDRDERNKITKSASAINYISKKESFS